MILNKSTIVHLPPGQSIAQDFLEEALVKFPTVFGFAIQHEGRLETENYPQSWKIEDINSILEPTKDGHRVIFLGNWPTYQDASDVPPFVVAIGEDKMAAIFCEGDFAGYDGLNDKHTAEFNMSDEVMYPRIEKAFKDAGEDYDKFVEQMKGKAFQQTLKNAYKHRGQFIILPKTGDPIVFGDNDIGETYSWGYVSNVDGLKYSEKSEVNTEAVNDPPADAPKLSFLQRMTGAKVAATPPAPKETVVHAQKPDVVLPKTDTSINYVFVKCPSGLERSVKNFWLRTFNDKENNKLPGDHQSQGAGVWVHPDKVAYAKREIKSTREMKNLVEEMRSGKKEVVDFPAKDKEKSVSTTREKFVPSTASPVDGASVLSPAAKEAAMTLLAGVLSKKHSPLDIQKKESKRLKFSDETGTKLDEMFFVPDDAIEQLFALDPKIGPNAYIEMRRWAIEHSGIKLEDLVTGSKGEEPKDTKVSPTDKHVLAKEELKPAAAQSGGLSFLRRTA